MPASEAALSFLVEDLALIRAAAEEAGRIALKYFRQSPEVWMKLGQSPVSEADFAVDRYLREALLKERPDYGWLSEETADTPDRLGRQRLFVVDPIDGTRAFLQGLEVWCVSIAVVESGRPLVGVLDCPARREVFTAIRGNGAERGGKPLKVSKPSDRPRVGGPKPMLRAVPDALRESFRPVPYVPSLAYRLAMVARGEMDATFIKANAHDWDLAAADLILHEAGGEIVDAAGRNPAYGGRDSRHGPLAAGSGQLLAAMAGVLSGFAA